MVNRMLMVLAMLQLLSCNVDSEVNGSRVDRLPFYQEATFTPLWMEAGVAPPDTFHRIGPFELLNQEGETVTEQTFAGKIYVADFFFTVCPGICPKMTDNMKLLQDEFLDDDEVLLLSHSVTPKYDSVPVLKRYAEEKEIVSRKWHLVTGDQQAIYKLGRHDYFVEESLGLKKGEDDFLHTENFVLVDKHRYIRGIYNGLNKTSVNQLIADIRTLKYEE
ncbi:SCO family protein [Lewinella sp. 4G2]|uniref:SCO family protein n=1 Tax=Lewinella sp. 4G2 TaxID=1803372 RepID=UPI0007B49481|nr:SCO family protein [Lewinella sp. 4G2]OAV45147.1 electron transporter [Lewinella sp. 4G2]